MLRETKTNGKKFRIRWSKVPRVLEPLNRVMSILVTRLATAVSSRKTPKLAINRNFPGLSAFSANVARDKNEWQKIPHPMVKSAARFGAPKSSYGHFSHPPGHGWGKFPSQKTSKMAINRNFPGLRAFSANVARDEKEEQEIPHPMIKSTARFGDPKIGLWPFYSPAWPRPFQAEKHPKRQ